MEKRCKCVWFMSERDTHMCVGERHTCVWERDTCVCGRESHVCVSECVRIPARLWKGGGGRLNVCG